MPPNAERDACVSSGEIFLESLQTLLNLPAMVTKPDF
jgi:hypothetical protein